MVLTDADRSVILGRVRKLLALADEHANVNEASSAYVRAHQLLEKYNLTEEEARFIENVALGLVEMRLEVNDPLPWHLLLAHTTARYHSCVSVPTSGTVHVLGLAPQVTRAVAMYGFIERQVYGFSPDRSFCLGAVNRVRSRLMQIRGRQVHGREDSALRTRTHLMIDEYVQHRYPTSPVTDGEMQLPPIEIDWETWQQGFEAGAVLQLEEEK